jgi:hypothetical protein
MRWFEGMGIFGLGTIGGLLLASLPAIIGALFLEWGLSRWYSRPFSRKELLTLTILAIGIRFVVAPVKW